MPSILINDDDNIEAGNTHSNEQHGQEQVVVESNSTERSEQIALRLLEQSEEPVGAARLARAWRDAGLPGAEATAGRFLRQLDESGHTQLLGATRGRTLTEAGRLRLQELDDQQRRYDHQTKIWRAINVTDVSDLIDLLHMRRMVEVEAARLAALRASDDELAALAEAANHAREDRLDNTTERSMGFHRLVAEASHNRIIGAVALLLLDPSNDPLEKLLEEISLDAGATLDQLGDHLHLARAIQERRPDEATAIMAAHMDKLIAAVERYRNEEFPESNGVARAHGEQMAPSGD